MKISLEWLGQFLSGSLVAEQLADALTNGGLPVEVIEQHGDDSVLDVEVTSNRGDCLSHVGVARELGALLNRPFKDTPPKAPEAATLASSVTAVAIEAPELCPHYTARVIRNVKVGPSPDWMVRRLEAVGLRPINNVVDVTNYVMFDMGQPLHAFDFDKLDGRRIVVRQAKAGEKIVSIDGHERPLKAEMLVIADASRPVALAGVMGGRDSEVSDATVNVLLESARFDPLSVRKTARALAMKSDSSYRFERGIDPTLPERASCRAAQLILETAGGELLKGVVSAGASGYAPKKLSLRLARMRQVLGVDLPTHEVVQALARLGFAPVDQGKHINVVVPSHRLDVNIEVDLIEEAARVIGYDKVPVKDEIAIRVTPPEPEAAAVETIRETLVGAGFFEAITVSFVSDNLAADFVPAEAAQPTGNAAGAVLPLPRTDPNVRKADAYLRPSILPGLLEAVRRNETVGTLDAKLFEIGSTFWLDADGNVVERRRLTLVGGNELRDVRGVVETILERLDPDRPVGVVPDSRPGFGKNASGRIEWGGEIVGHLGKTDRKVADKLSLRELPAGAELDLAPLLAGAKHVKQLHALPKFPAVRRDLTLDVAESVPYQRIESLVREVKPELLENLEYVTTYRGKPLTKGQKSVTVTLVFRSPTETLTGEAVEASVQRVVEAAKRDLNATLRA
jgi:phenylalanyl-tRNA synthetase beta chain